MLPTDSNLGRKNDAESVDSFRFRIGPSDTENDPFSKEAFRFFGGNFPDDAAFEDATDDPSINARQANFVEFSVACEELPSDSFRRGMEWSALAESWDALRFLGRMDGGAAVAVDIPDIVFRFRYDGKRFDQSAVCSTQTLKSTSCSGSTVGGIKLFLFVPPLALALEVDIIQTKF